MTAFLYILAVVLLNSQIAFSQDLDLVDEYFDVFDTDFKEWRLAFRGTAGINIPVWETYTSRQNVTVEPGCRQLQPGVTCTHHFRNNDVMDHWDNIDQVAFVVYKGGQRMAHIVFDGKSSDYLTWFSEDRIVSSTWADIKAADKNYFTIRGDDSSQTPVHRRFYINLTYHGCSTDVGWMVVVDSGGVCSWEVVPAFPAFLYAKSNTKTNWTTGDVGTADVIAVFVKYNNSPFVG